MIALIPFNKEIAKTIKVGTVFTERGKVRVVLKIQKRPDYTSDAYWVSKGVPYQKFGNTVKEFSAEMKLHPELKKVEYLYSIQDFLFTCNKIISQ